MQNRRTCPFRYRAVLPPDYGDGTYGTRYCHTTITAAVLVQVQPRSIVRGAATSSPRSGSLLVMQRRRPSSTDHHDRWNCHVITMHHVANACGSCMMPRRLAVVPSCSFRMLRSIVLSARRRHRGHRVDHRRRCSSTVGGNSAVPPLKLQAMLASQSQTTPQYEVPGRRHIFAPSNFVCVAAYISRQSRTSARNVLADVRRCRDMYTATWEERNQEGREHTEAEAETARVVKINGINALYFLSDQSTTRSCQFCSWWSCVPPSR